MNIALVLAAAILMAGSLGFTSSAYAGGGGEAAAPGIQFVEMEPLIVPVIDESGVSQTVSMVIALEVHTPEAKAAIEQMTPRLKDAFIMDMYGLLNQASAMKSGVIQIAYVKDRLAKTAAKVMGDDSITGVLLQVVNQRPV
ncbi:MAG: hypothetical protein L6Q57_08600 [Alphaproteobacteria bacterium]|nr:hypothetical protein [Alphaproteobacteria bacterium]